MMVIVTSFSSSFSGKNLDSRCSYTEYTFLFVVPGGNDPRRSIAGLEEHLAVRSHRPATNSSKCARSRNKTPPSVKQICPSVAPLLFSLLLFLNTAAC